MVPALWGLAALVMIAGAAALMGVPGGMAVPSDPSRETVRTAAPAMSADVHKLAEEVARLAAERDKLVARIEILERQAGARGLVEHARGRDEVPIITGSITPAVGTPAAGASTAGGSPSMSRADAMPDGPVRRIVFAVDLGTAPSVARLSDRWNAMQDLFKPTLAKLEARVVMGHNRDGGIELRLLAGPFANAQDAVKACAALQTQQQPCEPRPFEGEPLSKT